MENEKIYIHLPDRGFKLPDGYFDRFDARLMRHIQNNVTDVRETKQGPYSVPDHYFEKWDERFFDTLQGVEKKLSKNNFIIPENYFDNLEDRILLKLEKQEMDSLLSSSKEGFKIPSNYFDKLEENLPISQTKTNNPSKSRRLYFKSFGYAVAAMFIFVIGAFIFNLNKTQTKIDADPLATLTTEELLAYVDENVSSFDDQSLNDILTTEDDLNLLPIDEVKDPNAADELIEYLQ